jgi:predicted outer membrane protein
MAPHQNQGAVRNRAAVAGFGLALLLASSVPPAFPTLAQPSPPVTAVRPLNAEAFVRLAYSSAELQRRAAELAASRETRPEVRAFAQRMRDFRRDQIRALERAARDKTSPSPRRCSSIIG